MPYSPPVHSLRQTKVNRLEQQRSYNKNKRKNQEFYGSSQWRKVSLWYRKINPLCEDCKELNKATPVDVVDHIIELDDGGPKFDESNLRSRCHACHNAKTARVRVGRVKSL